MGSAQVKPSKSSQICENSLEPTIDICGEMEAENYPDTEALPRQEGESIGNDAAPKPDKAGSEKRDEGLEDAEADDAEDGAGAVKKKEKLDLSPEEIEAFKDDHVTKFQAKIKEAQSKDSYTNEEGDYTSEVTAVVMKLYRMYFEMNRVKKVPLAVLIKWRLRVASVAMDTKTVDLMCEIVKQTYPDRWLKEDGKMNYLLKFTILTLLNYSDASYDFAITVAHHPGLCEKLKDILQDRLEEHLNQSHSLSKEKMTQWSLSLLHNLSMPESNTGRLREVDILQLLVSYLATPKDMFRLNTFATLAAIINEKESEIIRANMDLVSFLLKVLSKASSTRLHRHNGWSCKECTLTVRMLARNDANKKLLVELGALELLVNLGKIGNQEEQYEAVSALWALSFDVDNRKKICCEEELGVVDLLSELKNSEDRKIAKVCEGALWTLRDNMKSSSIDKYKSLAESAVSQHTALSAGLPTNGREDAGHVMISYQWADQKTLISIRDQMKAAGIKVWMDIDQMGGSTLESMATAVEQAKLVLMCMSQKYKNSPNCRAEAEYAYQKQKPIVPLKMERGYMPDGWLGFICGAKLFFDFSGKYKFEDKMSQLVKEIATIYGRGGKAEDDLVIPTQAAPLAASTRHADQVDSRPVAAAGNSVTMATPTDPHFYRTIKTIRGWKSDDVQKWIEKNDLKSCGIGSLTGGEIALLMTMYQRAPESFFKCVHDTLKVKDLLTTSKIVWALSDLTGQ